MAEENKSEVTKIGKIVITDRAIDYADKLTDKLTGFLYTVLGQTVENGAGIFSSVTQYLRFKTHLTIADMAQKELEGRGVSEGVLPPSLRFTHRWTDQASLCDDDSIAEMYALLLANVVDPNRDVEGNPVFVEIVSQMSPLDAQIMNVIYSGIEGEFNPYMAFMTKFLPERAVKVDPSEKITPPNFSVQSSLWNLSRLSVLSHGAAHSGGGSVATVGVTALGYELYKAVKP